MIEKCTACYEAQSEGLTQAEERSSQILFVYQLKVASQYFLKLLCYEFSVNSYKLDHLRFFPCKIILNANPDIIWSINSDQIWNNTVVTNNNNSVVLWLLLGNSFLYLTQISHVSFQVNFLFFRLLQMEFTSMKNSSYLLPF